MSDSTLAGQTLDSEQLALRDALVRGRVRLGRVKSALAHLLQVDGQELFNDEIVARVRGMALDAAYRALMAQADVERIGAVQDVAAFRQEAIAQSLLADPVFTAHAHMLALEGQLAERLRLRNGLDPVSPKVLTDLIGSENSALAALAMSAMAAQARFIQHYRRMELPLQELPADVFHSVVVALRDSQDGPLRGEPRLRVSHDEGVARLGVQARLLIEVGIDGELPLDLDTLGVALFASALAYRSGEMREAVVLSMADNQSMRLCLSLRAAGLGAAAVQNQLVQLHSDGDISSMIDEVPVHDAQQWLSATAR